MSIEQLSPEAKQRAYKDALLGCTSEYTFEDFLQHCRDDQWEFNEDGSAAE